jgi:hypothetical protein
MYRFKEFKQITESMEIVESNFPIWVRMVVGGLVVKLRNINKKIESSDDPIEQNKLISQQNTLLGYINGLGIGITSDDKVLLQRMKGINRK